MLGNETDRHRNGSFRSKDASWLGRIVRRFNQRIGGSQEHLYAADMTMKPKELCDLLNERVKRRSSKAKGRRPDKTIGRRWSEAEPPACGL